MEKNRQSLLKTCIYITAFYGFVNIQDNLAEKDNDNSKNRGEKILQKKISKIRQKIEDFKKNIKDIERDKKYKENLFEKEIKQYEEKKNILEKEIEEQLNEIEMLGWKGFDGLKIYKVVRDTGEKINKNIQQIEKLLNNIKVKAKEDESNKEVNKKEKREKKEAKQEKIKRKTKNEDIKKEKKIKKEDSEVKDLEEKEEDKNKNFDFISKNGILSIKNSAILFGADIALEIPFNRQRRGEKRVEGGKSKWLIDTDDLNVGAKGDLHLNFNKKGMNKIYKKIKISGDIKWFDDSSIYNIFFKRKLPFCAFYKESWVNKIKLQHYFYENEKIKLGYLVGWGSMPYLNVEKLKGYSLDFISKIKRINTSVRVGIGMYIYDKEQLEKEEKVWEREKKLWIIRSFYHISIPFIQFTKALSINIQTKTDLKYCDFKVFFSFKFPKKGLFDIYDSIRIRGDVKFKNIKNLDYLLLKVYYGNNFKMQCVTEALDTSFDYNILGFAGVYKNDFSKLRILKLFGFEKFKCKINLVTEFIIKGNLSSKNFSEKITGDKTKRFKGKLGFHIGILKLKEKRFKTLGKFQTTVFSCVFKKKEYKENLEKGIFNEMVFDLFSLKYNVMKGLTLSLHLLKFTGQICTKKEKIKIENKPIEEEENNKKEEKNEEENIGMGGEIGINNKQIGWNWSWTPSFEIKFDLAKYLLEKKKKI